MIHIENKETCCGCTACAAVCPKDAITMQPDAMGFLYPRVDRDKCVDCGLCERVCAFSDAYDTSDNFARPIPLGVRQRDPAELAASQSGGAFAALAVSVLAEGGVVYGAGYGEGFRVVHKRAASPAELAELRGSKYVQSDVGSCFRAVRADLRAGRHVLFSGTPCQVAGLKSFIGPKLGSGLLLADIVCHGVPSPYVWRDNLKYIAARYGSPIVGVNFRDKRITGWHGCKESYSLDDGRRVVSTAYTRAFFKDIMLREACGCCPFANVRRPSDVSLADFWGVERTSPTFADDNRGCSLVLLNTERGRALFERARGALDVLPAELENCMQGHLRYPSAHSSRRAAFVADYEHRGFRHAMRRFGFIGWRASLRGVLAALKHKITR